MEKLAQRIPGKPGHFTMTRPKLDLFRPHKYPMVLLEEVANCSTEKATLTGTKHVRLEDPYVQGHFPGDPFMPPVFVVEGLAQAAGALMNLMFYSDRGVEICEITVNDFLTLEQPPFNVLAEAKIKQLSLAVPGETIALSVKILLRRKDIIAFHAEAAVGDRSIAKGEIMLAYPPYTPPINPDKATQEAANAPG
jgi:3-hydroxyacyl-[acyl-carrier-protein] dehydratase